MPNTANYNLPLYSETDVPDLLTVYNAAMQTIDTTLKTISNAASKGFVTADSDKSFTVSSLAAAKINADGIVYFKEG
nr:MAG TPA: hypothetical protein [Bacteriophage sp.]